MIGFNHLGKLGRLGNQMFQFAAVKGIARNNGYEYCIPPSRNQNEWEDHQLFVPFKMASINQSNIQFIGPDRPIISERDFSFDENLFNTCQDDITLFGYFQSEKYFKHIESEIKQDFEFKEEIKIPCLEIVSELKNPISLHIRRTDYINNPNHTSLDLDYYKEALNQVDKSSPVLVFSDDSEWCKMQPLFSDERFLISEGNSNYIDMCLMTLCEEHIIANSSFSWWGAWLANSKKVVAPKNWFGGDCINYNTEDLYCSGWIIL